MTPAPTEPPSAEAMEAARELYWSDGFLSSTAKMVERIARAIDAALKRGQVAEREECARVADARARDHWKEKLAAAAAPDAEYDVEDEETAEAAAMEAEDIATAIRARTP